MHKLIAVQTFVKVAERESFTAAAEALGLSRDELAEKVGVTRMSVSHWENGIRNPGGPSKLLLHKLFRKVLQKSES